MKAALWERDGYIKLRERNSLQRERIRFLFPQGERRGGAGPPGLASADVQTPAGWPGATMIARGKKLRMAAYR